MRTRLSDDFVLKVKDQLRIVRYRIRRGARDARPFVGRGDPLAPAPVAVATDAIFSQVEAAAAAFLPKDEVALYAFPFPQPVAAYFASGASEAHDLSPKIYSALKAFLFRIGTDVSLVSEQLVHEACESVLAQQVKAISAALDPALPAQERFDACVSLCASLAVALVSAQPVLELMSAAEKRGAAKNLFRAPNEYCAFVVGLAIALASRPDAQGADPQSLAEAADLAVNARFKELSAALKKRKAADALATEFDGLLRFLP